MKTSNWDRERTQAFRKMGQFSSSHDEFECVLATVGFGEGLLFAKPLLSGAVMALHHQHNTQEDTEETWQKEIRNVVESHLQTNHYQAHR